VMAIPASAGRLDPESCAFKGLFRVTLLPDVELSYLDLEMEEDKPRQLHLISGVIKSVECRVSLELASLQPMPFNEYASQARRYVGAIFVSSVAAILAIIAQMNYTATSTVRLRLASVSPPLIDHFSDVGNISSFHVKHRTACYHRLLSVSNAPPGRVGSRARFQRIRSSCVSQLHRL
jgi:hypothetical protein